MKEECERGRESEKQLNMNVKMRLEVNDVGTGPMVETEPGARTANTDNKRSYRHVLQ